MVKFSRDQRNGTKQKQHSGKGIAIALATALFLNFSVKPLARKVVEKFWGEVSVLSLPLTLVSSTPLVYSWCIHTRLSCSTKCPVLYRRGKPGTKISYHRWSRYRSCGSELPTARSRLSPDFVQIAALLASNASAQHYLFWIICHRRFHYSLSSAVLSKGASKAKIVWHLSMLL